MTWGQALAFQGSVAAVYPETDDPAYRVVFESVIQSLQTVPTAPPTPGGCASEQGFSLHAEVCCAAHQRKKLDHLCPTSRAPPWLLKRVFDIDLEHCPRCGGPLKIIAAIEDPPVIAKILTTHLGLPARAPPRSPARAFNRTQLA